VFTDERFHLIDGDDEIFLTFICEAFHPAVTKNSSEDERFPEFYCLEQISDILKAEGYELYESKRMGNKPVIAWKDIGVAKAVIDEQAIALRQVFDSDYMQQQSHQMQTSVDTNPSDAIGKAKELIESCCKTILENKGVTVDKTGTYLGFEMPPFVRQYGILSSKWGVMLCQREYQTNGIRQNLSSWS
jgi:hypothetical protein